MITDPEDLKIITLAKSALARTGAAQGACLRDTDGRTYAAATVDLDHLKLSALQVVIAMAASSGAQGVEAIAVCGGGEPTEEELQAVTDLAARAPDSGGFRVWVADEQGIIPDDQGRVRG